MNGPGVYLECMFSAEVTPPPKNLRGESDMKKDHPTQGFLHSGLEKLQGRKFHNVFGQPGLMFSYPHTVHCYPMPLPPLFMWFLFSYAPSQSGMSFLNLKMHSVCVLQPPDHLDGLLLGLLRSISVSIWVQNGMQYTRCDLKSIK